MHHQIITNQVAFASVNITEEVKTLNFLTNHIAIIHNHRLVIGENRNHTSNKPNNTKSTNAVIFAKAAKLKNNQAIMIYFMISFLSLVLFIFCKNISPANKASNDNAITLFYYRLLAKRLTFIQLTIIITYIVTY